MLSTASASRSALLATSRPPAIIALSRQLRRIRIPSTLRIRPMSMSSGQAPSSGGHLAGLPDASIPVFQTLDQLRTWRYQAFREEKSVGFVPTMGALHAGHLALVKRSLEDNDLTIVSIFVNPAQFAPHEDFGSYPRTLPQDLTVLSALTSPPQTQRTTSAVFVPSIEVMYPPPHDSSSFFHSEPPDKSSSSPSASSAHNSPSEVGTFVEVKGLSSVLEGRSRPTFFRGVTTVVTKLFNAVQPTHAYFGQKDIQQGLLLRRMVQDLLMAHPTPETLHIVPTARSEIEDDDGLALSSRNSYLNRYERAHAPALYRALKRGQTLWESGATKEAAVRAALDVLEMEEIVATEDGVHLKIDYVQMNDPWTLDVVPNQETKNSGKKEDRPFVLSGAIWVGGTRLIDNVVLGDSGKILY